jgi:putative membrane protein
MLYHDAGLAWLHFVLAFLLVGALCAELFVLRLPVNAPVARLLLRIDLFYGVSALLLILAGAARVVWGAKGWNYYQGDYVFWAKMALFAMIGLISIGPTLAYLRWVGAAKADVNFIAPDADVKRIRMMVTSEVHLIAVLLALAVLLARGLGQG